MCVVLECDKAICLNELGRMMSWYGDREYSGTFFRKSLDTVLVILQDRKLIREDRKLKREERLKHFHPKLVHLYVIFRVHHLEYIGKAQYICYDGISMGCGVRCLYCHYKEFVLY